MGAERPLSRGVAEAGLPVETAGLPARGRDPRLDPLFATLDSLPGVGPGMAARLSRLLGRERPRVRDLLFHLPRAALDVGPRAGLGDADLGRTVALEVTVIRHRSGHGRAPSRVEADCAAGRVDLVFFNARKETIERRFPVGSTLRIAGRLQQFRGRLQMAHPERLEGAGDAGRLPLYPLTADLSHSRLRRIVSAALERMPQLPEWLDGVTLPGGRFPGFGEALRALHDGAADPADLLSPARQRLAFDELFALQLGLAILRRERDRGQSRPLRGDGTLCGRLLDELPFPPTRAQRRAFDEIAADLASGAPMTRLIQGDVGSGKTLVALLAMLRAVEAGQQAVLMAPTEVLARQHARNLGRMLAPLGLQIGLLTGREAARDRAATLAGLRSGELLLCVGTQALFQSGVQFARLGLAVVDEQHRFGVEQRLALVAKGGTAHLLLLTATPIPRSLLLSWYGDIAVSRLDEKPAGRAPVSTRVLPLTRLADVLEGIGRALDRGERGYWVCPAIAPAESGDIAAAEARFAALRERFGDRVGLVHGGLDRTAKARVMDAFARGAVRLLVATTVIEVGIDVPEAGLMVIEQAERFGLAQLHQLRGRIGRGDRPGTCLMLYRPPLGQVARRRLSLLRECDDGFRLAEEDLRLRGPGEVLGVQQSGMPRFRVADPAVHEPLLRLAADEAKRALRDDPDLASPRGRALRILLDLFDQMEARRLLAAG